MDYNSMLKKISTEYEKILGENLVGIYVHGSIAFGCFNPSKSDIDFIVVVKSPLTIEEKEGLIKVLLNLEYEAPVKGFEMSVVLEKFCKDFIYPTPYELHYSRQYLNDFREDLRKNCLVMNGVDKDLAAHFTVIKSVGYSIIGKEVDEVFEEVLCEYYLDSIECDVIDARNEVLNNPVYIVLNLCRVLAYKRVGLVLSKEQGGLWGIENLSNSYSKVIDVALKNYISEDEEDFDKDLLLSYCDYMKESIF